MIEPDKCVLTVARIRPFEFERKKSIGCLDIIRLMSENVIDIYDITMNMSNKINGRNDMLHSNIFSMFRIRSWALCQRVKFTNTEADEQVTNISSLSRWHPTIQINHIQFHTTINDVNVSLTITISTYHKKDFKQLQQQAQAVWTFSSVKRFGRVMTLKQNLFHTVNAIGASNFQAYVADRLNLAAHRHSEWTSGSMLNWTPRNLDDKMSKWSKRVRAPAGYEYIEPVMDALERELRERMNEPHEGKRQCEALWPVHQINWQRSRYVYDMFYKYKKISREVYDYCIRRKLVDSNLIAKWKKPGYERLCSTFAINTKNYNYGTVSICRVPRQQLSEGQVIQEKHSGCRGCASGPGGYHNIFGNKYGQYLARIQIAREEAAKKNTINQVWATEEEEEAYTSGDEKRKRDERIEKNDNDSDDEETKESETPQKKKKSE
ncbi:g10-like protein [Plasmopara halstedii]|uniref:G10-like protein n=1 Tax=Plasmopara halstedii TaxID=4781 RepID=A0A0P1AK55_PLAHL|nr:g10-like protein [Plasmopara halstedii]CEG40977.1 g10-like protein [Plasmopara halstedii]|eukprot:XP_024577346.1 g10-like protein [Plasmopara halstedii]